MGVQKEEMKPSQQPKTKAKLQAKYIDNCFFLFKYSFIRFMCVCNPKCMFVHSMHAGAYGDQKRAVEHLSLELQAVQLLM